MKLRLDLDLGSSDCFVKGGKKKIYSESETVPAETSDLNFAREAPQTRSVSRDAMTDTSELDYLFKESTFKSKDFTESYFLKDNDKVKFYTGLPSFEILRLLFNLLNHTLKENHLYSVTFKNSFLF